MEVISQKVNNDVADTEARLASQVDHALEALSELNTKVVNFVQERPTTCLIGALAFGFIVGRIASRR